MIKLGLIGYGMSAQTFHAPFIQTHPDCQLWGIASSKPKSAMPQAVKHYAGVEALLADDAIDVVVNTAPTGYHYALTKQALAAKKHVVLEKPMCTKSTEAAALIELATAQNCLLAVYHNRRFCGDFLTVQQLLNDKRLGDLRRAEFHFDRFRPNVRDRWKENAGEGAGILYDLGSHLIDQALQLFGKPAALTARSIALREHSPSDDYFHIQLHYADKEVILHSSPFSSAPNPVFRLEGTRGSFVKYGIDPQEAQLQAGIMPDDATFGADAVDDYGILYDGDGNAEAIATQNGDYAAFYRNLVMTLNAREELLVKPQEALAVIRLIEIVQQSSRQGKTIAC